MCLLVFPHQWFAFFVFSWFDFTRIFPVGGWLAPLGAAGAVAGQVVVAVGSGTGHAPFTSVAIAIDSALTVAPVGVQCSLAA